MRVHAWSSLFCLLAGVQWRAEAMAERALGAASQDALHAAGPQAEHILSLWWVIGGICTIVFVAVLLVFLYALRHAPRAQRNTPVDLTSLELPERGAQHCVVSAAAVSTVLLLVLIVASVMTDRALARLVLHDALHIEVTAHQWWWEARYDDTEPSRMFNVANELHIPVGRPVIFTLKSDDVIHSLWVPNLAGKKDLIPGRTATLQLRADRAGTYRGQCAEFCGLQHAWMAFLIIADEPGRYETWAAEQRQPAGDPSNAQLVRGQQAFLSGTCVMCHAIAGTQAGAHKAPDLTHVGGRQTLAAGTLPNTPDFLASWIVNPQAYKPGVNMPGHRFAAEDLQALVAYLESLK